MKVISLFSGSSGNCTVVELEKRTILIDAGGSARAICEGLNAIGSDICRVTDIFITHEHGDHTHALGALLKKYPVRVHMTSATADALGIAEGSPLSYCLVRYGREYLLELPDCTVEAFEAPHDSACCVGYRITEGNTSVGVVTDVGYITQRVYDRLCGCEAVVIEANHDVNMVKNGRYPAALKRRILSGGGHLSNDCCAEIAAALARQGTKKLMLAHLSDENNTPEAACACVKNAVDAYGVSVVCAERDEATVLM